MSGDAWITGNGYHDAPLRIDLLRASGVPVERPSWLWTDRVPTGGFTLLPGREGLGKTAFVLHLASRVTRGQLPGDWHGRPGVVVYVGVEDSRGAVLVPRLLAAGADLDRVHFVTMREGAPFAVGTDVDELLLVLKKDGLGDDLAVVIVDPLDAHLGPTVDAHRKAEVQRALGLLATLAQERDCAVVGVAHLNKGDSRELLLRVVGSVGFTTSARSVLGIGEHPEDPADRVCVLAKSNFADRTAVPAIRFRVEGTEVAHPDGGTVDTAAVVILGEEHGIDPDAIVSGLDHEARTERDAAVDWLVEVLTEGPLSSREVKAAARDAGHAERTIHRARGPAGVVVERDVSQRGRPSFWRLAGSCQPDSCHPLPAPDGTKGLGRETGPDRASEGGSCHESGTGNETLDGRPAGPLADPDRLAGEDGVAFAQRRAQAAAARIADHERARLRAATEGEW